jgi:type II secretory pathway component PulJ
MGFSTIIDILGSIAIGGVLLIILWRLDDAATQNVINNGQEVVLQQNLATVASIIEHDFRKIGYCENWNKIPDPSKSIVRADSNSITFLTDDNDDGNIDTLKYLLGPTSELSSTPNTKDRLLYRILNGVKPQEANMGITQFTLEYYDTFGNRLSSPVANPGTIVTIAINITVEDSYAYDNKYSQAFWRQIRLAARNLQNR